MVGATVAVCTRNRARLLERCLASLDTLLAEPGEIEVLVVDNGSDDDTPGLLEQWEKSGADRRAVIEPRVGLSHARNTALELSGREVVIFIDDDALTPPTWAKAHLDVYRGDAGVGAAGGPVRLTWPAGRPPWVDTDLTQWLSVLDLGDEPGPWPNSHGPYGANMSVRREAALAVGGFDPQLGRSGGRLLSSEERDLSRRLDAAGWTMRYIPQATVVHQITSERLSRRWLLRRGWAQGLSNARFEALGPLLRRKDRLGAARLELRTAWQVAARRNDGDRDRFAALVEAVAHASTAAELVRTTVPSLKR